MAPSTHLEVSPEPEVIEIKHLEQLVLDSRKTREVPAVVIDREKGLEEGTFKSSMLEFNRMKSSSRFIDTVISLSVNLVILAGPVFAGLYFTDTINLKQLQSTFLVAPPPPPPPPPAPTAVMVKAAPVHRVFENGGKLIAPTVVPRTIAEIKEAPFAADLDTGGGVPGGVPGGVVGG